MRISRRLLRPDERILTSAGPHPIRLAGPVARLALGLAAVTAVGFVVTPTRGDDPVDVVCAAVALFLLARFVIRFLSWRRRRVVVTDQRLLQLSGGMFRRVGSVPLELVTQVDLVQGPAGRMFGYGKLDVRAGSETLTLPVVRDAAELWAVLCEASGLAPVGRAGSQRALAPGVPFDEQDTGPLPRVVV